MSMDLNDPAIIKEFIDESNEHLSDVEAQLLEIEQAGANIDTELVNTVFRAVHSIKGTAGFMGLDTIQLLAHNAEGVLNLIRNRELVPTKPIVECLLGASDDLRNLVNDLEHSNDADVSARVQALLEITEKATAACLEDDSGESSEPDASASHPGAAAPATGSTTSLPSEVDHAADEEAGDEPSLMPSSAQATATSGPGDSTSPAVAAMLGSAEASSGMPAATARVEVTAEKEKPNAVAKSDASIRVNVGTLDRLMNLAGELVLRRNCLMQLTTRRGDNELNTIAAGLNQVTSCLQDTIMQTRMQPIGNVFSRFPRVVRDLNAKLGKECEVILDGVSVEVDKTILEAIGDPLTHLVRNAIDHGIEKASDRITAGKPTIAQLRLWAYHQAGRVCIDVSDDGRGIDPAKLREKAVAKNLISHDAASRMSDREAINLIFHPGFSTAAQVTDVSGRGVGMDVVRTNIEKLGGTVDVESQVGVGTTIRIVLPLTLAIIPSLIVRSCGQRFAVPQVNIVELVRVPASQRHERIGKVRDVEVLRLRGELLPMVYLEKVLRIPEASPEDQLWESTGDGNSDRRPLNVLVVETGEIRYGLVVDELRDSQEIVVKPLGRHIKDCKALDAATILGDGHIAWILSIAGIATLSQLSQCPITHGEMDRKDSSSDGLHDRQHFVLFTNQAGEWFCVPMDVVLRVDRITPEQIVRVGNQETIEQHDTSLPLLRVESSISAQACPDPKRLTVIVFKYSGREIGLVAHNIHDIRTVSAAIDTVTCVESGVLGSFITENHTVRLLDVYQITRDQHPEWFEAPKQTTNLPANILVVEDSGLVRKQLIRTLTVEGFRTIEAEDGQTAWDLLQAGSEEVSLVVTDIEMPHMTGLELCRRVKQWDRTRHIPVIILSSLGADSDIERGRAAGVDEYHVKFNQDTLVAGVQRLLGRSVPLTNSANKVRTTVG